MGIFSFFSRKTEIQGIAESLVGRRPRKFKGSPKQMGIVLITAWKVYCEKNPNFNPHNLDFYHTHEALRFVCSLVGYDENWASVYCQQPNLGGLALILLACDLMPNNQNLRKGYNARHELYQCFCQFLPEHPEQIGELKDYSEIQG